MIDYPRSQPTRDPDVRLWREAPAIWRVLVRIDGEWAPSIGAYPRKSDALASLPGQMRVTLSAADVRELRSYLDDYADAERAEDALDVAKDLAQRLSVLLA